MIKRFSFSEYYDNLELRFHHTRYLNNGEESEEEAEILEEMDEVWEILTQDEKDRLQGFQFT